MAEERPNRLGRGLSALLGYDESAPPPVGVASSGPHPRALPISKLRPSPLQPRRNFDEAALAELTASVKEKGILQPLLVRPAKAPAEGFEIVAGERRWRAAQRAGVHDVPVVVRVLSDQEVLEIALIENVQRADLNAVEEARGYRTLIDQFTYTQEELARVIGKSRSHIANALRLLTLPESVLSHVETGKLSAGHARTLVGQPDPEALAERIMGGGLSVRAAEDLVRTATSPAPARAGEGGKDPDTVALERELEGMLGLKLDIRDKGGKGGEVRIGYRTLEQLEDLCERLRGRVRAGAAA